jgi:hypothetical protein
MVVPPTVKITTSHPFELMAVDLVQFPRTSSGYLGCCVLVDHNSKWTCVVPIKNKYATTVVNVIEERMLPFLPRIPLKILSDNGPEFTSQVFGDLLSRYSITHIHTTPYKPSSNGCVERVNRTIGEVLRGLSSSEHWDRDITRAVIIYNSTKHRELGMSPSDYLLARQHEFADSPLLTNQQVSYWKLGHPNFLPFKVGQQVVRKVPLRGKTTAAKFQPKYDGPYSVTHVNENGLTYVLRAGDSGREINGTSSATDALA